MKDRSQEELERTRPPCGIKPTVDFCLSRLFADRRRKITDEVCEQLSFEELIGALLLSRDLAVSMLDETDDRTDGFRSYPLPLVGTFSMGVHHRFARRSGISPTQGFGNSEKTTPVLEVYKAAVVKWWVAWRSFTEAVAVADLFEVKQGHMRRWLRHGLAQHEWVDGLGTCAAVRGRWGRVRWFVHPLGFAHWHMVRLAGGLHDAPGHIRNIENIWADVWRAARHALPEHYKGACPSFSWARVARDPFLLSCAMALVWKASGLEWGGPFILGAEMPGDFAAKILERQADSKKVAVR